MYTQELLSFITKLLGRPHIHRNNEYAFNCPFCNHPDRDSLEQQIRTGILKPEDLDRSEGWASGSAHRHMRRHAGDYHNNSNSDCPICTHPERAEIESSILEGRAGIEEFAYELNVDDSIISHHMEKHIKPLIKAAAEVEMIPTAIQSTRDSLAKIEKNMNRLDSIFTLHLDGLEAQYIEEAIVDFLSKSKFRITQIKAPVILESFTIPDQSVNVKLDTLLGEYQPILKTLKKLATRVGLGSGIDSLEG